MIEGADEASGGGKGFRNSIGGLGKGRRDAVGSRNARSISTPVKSNR